jgi:quercetin dioxygenase-like cupin family protein
MNIPEVAVQMATLTAGTLFPTHTHNEKEVVVIYKGKAIHIMLDRDEPVGAGDVIICHPHEVHSFRALTQTEVIAITVPSSPGYPKK